MRRYSIQKSRVGDLMKFNIETSDYIKLLHLVNNTVHDAFSMGGDEPQLVANLIWYVANNLKNITISSNFALRTGGVFVHGRPLVTCDKFKNFSPSSVEIGDLLLIRNLVENGNVVDRKALLLQAKITGRLPVIPDNKTQHYLYEMWPEFYYVRSTPALNGKQRKVDGFDLYDAAKYLLIIDKKGKNQVKNNCHLTSLCIRSEALTAKPTSKLSAYQCFVVELVEFILGNAGKTFVTPSPNNIGWDKVIEDLTTIMGNKCSVYMNRASNGGSDLRGQNTFFMTGLIDKFSTLSEGRDVKSNLFLELPPEGVGNKWGDDEGGISILEFTVETEIV